MSVQYGETKRGKFARWGDSGRQYYYNDDTSKDLAAKKAELQGSNLESNNVPVKKFNKISDINLERTLFIFDDFDDYTAEDIVRNLIELDSKGTEDINIIINSRGGIVSSLFAITDTINSITADVNTICLGKAYSCGANLLSVGKQRYIGYSAKSMIHEVSAMTWGKMSEMKKQLMTIDDVNERTMELLSKNTNQDKTYITELCKQDEFMNAGETISFGLADFTFDQKDIEKFIEELEDSDKLQIANSITNDSLESIVSSILNKKKEGGKRSNTHTVIKIKKKGDISTMDKDQLITALNEHGIDVLALLEVSDKLTEITNELVEIKSAKEAVDAELISVKEANAKASIDAILNKLIDEGKSSQEYNEEVFAPLFATLSIEEAQAKAEKLPVLVNFNRQSSGAGDEEVTNSRDAAIRQYMADNNMEDNDQNYAKASKEVK